MAPELKYITPSPELVLLCIRERWATTSDMLVTAFGYLPEESHTGHFMLQDALEKLEQANLISIDGKQEPFRMWSFASTSNLLNIQVALGVSLKALAANLRHDRMIVSPIFGRADANDHRYDVFVLMPFSDALAPVYKDHIASVLTAMSLTYARADDFFSAREIMRDVWSGIYNADIVIADCTDKNPNVFYELGISHAIGKSAIMITQRTSDIPFDVGNIRYLAYDFTPRGMKDFEQTLRSTIESVRGDQMARLRHSLYRTPDGR